MSNEDLPEQKLQSTTEQPRIDVPPVIPVPKIDKIDPADLGDGASDKAVRDARVASTRDAVQAAREAVNVMNLRDKLDLNDDGRITGTEVAGSRITGKDLDVNQDGRLDKADLEKINSRLKNRMDPAAEQKLSGMIPADKAEKSDKAVRDARVASTSESLQAAREAVNVMNLRGKMDLDRNGRITGDEVQKSEPTHQELDVTMDGRADKADFARIADKLKDALTPEARQMLAQMTHVGNDAKSPMQTGQDAPSAGKGR